MKKTEDYTLTYWLTASLEGALIQSMRRSKTLTIMVLTGLTFFAAFIYFLYKMAGL